MRWLLSLFLVACFASIFLLVAMHFRSQRGDEPQQRRKSRDLGKEEIIFFAALLAVVAIAIWALVDVPPGVLL